MTVTATVGLNEAADRAWDVIVVGAGPAGSMAALELARWGSRVLLVDKASFPRWKVCGSCLNGRALSILKAAGIARLPTLLGAVRLNSLCLAANHRKTFLPLPEGMVLSRLAFDAGLIDEARARGAHFLPETRVALKDSSDTHRHVILQGKAATMRASAHLVIVADGLGGALMASAAASGHQANTATSSHTHLAPSSWMGAGTLVTGPPGFYQPGVVFMACGSEGYVGLVGIEDGRLDVAAALNPIEVKKAGQPGIVAEAILRQAGLPIIPHLSDNLWRGTPLLTRRAHSRAFHRLFVLGDAAGYVEPFTGEGMAWALAAGRAVVPLALRGISHWNESIIEDWNRRYYEIVTSRQDICRLLALFLRRPILRDAAFAVLRCLPSLVAPVTRRLNR